MELNVSWVNKESLKAEWFFLSRNFSELFYTSPVLLQDYDDGYGTAYDEQSYDSYDNSYSTPAQR